MTQKRIYIFIINFKTIKICLAREQKHLNLVDDSITHTFIIKFKSMKLWNFFVLLHIEKISTKQPRQHSFPLKWLSFREGKYLTLKLHALSCHLMHVGRTHKQYQTVIYYVKSMRLKYWEREIGSYMRYLKAYMWDWSRVE